MLLSRRQRGHQTSRRHGDNKRANIRKVNEGRFVNFHLKGILQHSVRLFWGAFAEKEKVKKKKKKSFQRYPAVAENFFFSYDLNLFCLPMRFASSIRGWKCSKSCSPDGIQGERWHSGGCGRCQFLLHKLCEIKKHARDKQSSPWLWRRNVLDLMIRLIRPKGASFKYRGQHFQQQAFSFFLFSRCAPSICSEKTRDG